MNIRPVYTYVSRTHREHVEKHGIAVNKTGTIVVFTEPIPSDTTVPEFINFLNMNVLFQIDLKQMVEDHTVMSMYSVDGRQIKSLPAYDLVDYSKVSWKKPNDSVHIFKHIRHYEIDVKDGLLEPKYFHIVDKLKSFKTFESVDDLINKTYHFKYGVYSKQFGFVDADKKKDLYKSVQDMILQSPEQFMHNKGGMCWDWVNFCHYHLTLMGISHHSFYILFDTNNKFHTHTFIMYKTNDEKWKLLEPGFSDLNIRDESDNIFFIARKATDMELDKKPNGTKAFVRRINEYPQAGTDSRQYMRIMDDTGTLVIIKEK